MAEFEIRKRDRHCTVTGNELQPGQVVYSALVQLEDEIVRQDFSEESWSGPPEESIGWWKAVIPDNKSGRVYWAPNSVVLSYFHELREQPDQAEVAYLLSLLMVRRRILKMEDFEDAPITDESDARTIGAETTDETSDQLEDTSADEGPENTSTSQVMIVTDPGDDTEYRIPVVDVHTDQIEAIQERLCELLFSDEPPEINHKED